MKNALFTLSLFLLFDVHAQHPDRLKPLVVEDASEVMTLEESMEANYVHSVSYLRIDENGNEGVGAYESDSGFREIPINTLYQAGSISKSVAAVGVMVLVDKYELDLDASVNSYLKSWQLSSEEFDADKVTIRNLLSHTAGTTVHGFMGYKKEKKVPEIIEILDGEGNSDEVTMFNQADSTWKYSGGGYQILHLLVEDISGEDFALFMQKEVLDPIGMTKSTYEIKLPGTCDECAHAYNRKGEAYKPDWYLYPESAAAGLWTNTSDLATFLEHLHAIYNGGEGILSTATIKEMFTPVASNYGFGFIVHEREGEVYVGHSGKNIGFSNDMTINLNTGEGYVILTDSDGAFPVIEDIKRSILGDGIWTNRPQIVANRVEISASEMEHFAGDYYFKMKGRLNPKAKLYFEDDQLMMLNKNAGLVQELIPVGENNFIAKEDGSSIQFIEEEGQMFMIFDNRFKFTRQ